jgi:anti-sigma factor (TIGR02949 family)
MTNWLMRLFGHRAPGDLDCHQVAEVLQHYLDGEIDEERSRRIEAHLEACRRCGMEAETYRRIKATLAARRGDVPAESIRRLEDFGRRLVHGD